MKMAEKKKWTWFAHSWPHLWCIRTWKVDAWRSWPTTGFSAVVLLFTVLLPNQITLFIIQRSGPRIQLPNLPRIPNLWLSFNSDHFWRASSLELAYEFSSPRGDHVLTQLKILELDSSLVPHLDIHLQRTPGSTMCSCTQSCAHAQSLWNITDFLREREFLLTLSGTIWFYCFWDLGWSKWRDIYGKKKKKKFLLNPSSCAQCTVRTEFGAEKGLLQGPNKENGWLTLKRPGLPMTFRQGFLKTELGERILGYMMRSWTFWLVGGEVQGLCFHKLNILVPTSPGSSACGQHVLTILHLSGES